MGAGSRYREVHSRGVPEEHLFEPIRVLRRHGELLRGDGHIAVVDGERVVGARVQLRVRVRDGRRAVAEDVPAADRGPIDARQRPREVVDEPGLVRRDLVARDVGGHRPPCGRAGAMSASPSTMNKARRGVDRILD